MATFFFPPEYVKKSVFLQAIYESKAIGFLLFKNFFLIFYVCPPYSPLKYLVFSLKDAFMENILYSLPFPQERYCEL